MKLTLNLVFPFVILLSAVGVEWLCLDYPQAALYLGWLLSAVAVLSVIFQVEQPLGNELGRDDPAHFVTLGWFVLLASALASASIWNILNWNSTYNTELSAFVSIPADLWVLAGITLASNAAVRAAFVLKKGSASVQRSRLKTPIQELMSSPTDEEGKPNMLVGQYVMLNMIAVVVYGIAIAQIFYRAPWTGTVLEFPNIPPEILSLIGVSGGGFALGATSK